MQEAQEHTLKIEFCKEIQELPGLEHLMSLEEVTVRNCSKLQGVGVTREQ